MLVALLGLALILFGLAFVRISRNVGVLTLEELARRKDIVYAPLAREIAEGDLAEWSKPLRIRCLVHRGQPVAELQFTAKLSDDDPADGGRP